MRWQKSYVLRAIMDKEKKFASQKEIEKELQSLDLVFLLRKLEDYAVYRLHDNDRNKAFDVVGQAFDKIISQERKWYEGSSLISTLFLVVKSLSDNENKKLKRSREVDGLEIDTIASPSQRDQFDDLNLANLKSIALNILKNHNPPPDYLEELIFECWIEGMKKQQEIARYLEKDIVDIRNGVKRLKRKLGPVKDEFIKMGYEQE